MRSWQQWLIYVAAALLPLWRAFTGSTIGPWDHIRPMAGLPAGNPAYPWDVLQADAALQFYPWRDLVFHSWQNVVPPFYNPYQLAGVPLLANSQSAGFYPPHILIGLLHLPTSLGIALLALFHLVLAGMGVHRLAEKFGAHPMGALTAGISFALCPFMIGWTGLASVTSTVAWIPWILLAIADLLDEEKNALKTTVRLALLTGLMIFAGHLQFVAFGALGAAVFAICLAIAKRPKLPRVGLGIAGLVLGVLLAGPQLKPVLEFSQHSHRRNPPSAAGFEAYQASAIQGWELGNFVNPITLGDPRTFAGETGLSTYWPSLAKRGANWTESAVAPGAIVVVCLCFVPVLWRRMKSAWPLIVVGGLGFLIAMGSPLNAALYYGVPGWSATGSPGRAIVLFLMAACVLAGIVVGNLVHTKEGPPFSLRGAQLSALAFAMITFATFAIGQKGAIPLPDVPAELFKAVNGSATAWGLMITLAVAFLGSQPPLVAFFLSKMKPATSVLPIFPVGVVLVALVTGAMSAIPMGEAIPSPGAIEARSSRVAYTNSNWGLTVAAKASMPPNLATIKREADVSGYDSLLHKDVQMWMSSIDGEGDPAPPANGNIMFVKPGADQSKLSEAGVAMLDGSPIQGGGRAILRSDGREASCEVKGQTLQSVTVAVPGPGELTLRDHNLGGWTARAGGQNLPLKDGPWLTVDVPPGAGEVVFSYSPPGLAAGLAMFAVAILVLGGLWVASRKVGDHRAN